MDKTADYQRRVNAATNRVARNLGKHHSIEGLAAAANFSKFHFHRIYRAITGETVANMVSRLRLEGAAATLIYNKRRSITQVAVDHGYSSGANFTKAFTRHFGCPPSVYRSNSKIGKATSGTSVEDERIEYAVKITHQAELQLAYYRRKGSYQHMEISAMHKKVQQWVEDRQCVASERESIGITWSDSFITDEMHWIYDACVAVQAGTEGDAAISMQRLPAGLVAQLEVELAANESHDLSRYWDWLVRDWFLASDYELRASPCFERYDSAASGFKVQLCLPLELNTRRT